MTSSNAESPICLIIGCGPVGALAGNLLGVYGVRTLILEREARVLDLPRAVHFDDETMRIFQAVGLHERLQPMIREVEGMDLVDARGRTLLALEAAANPSPLGHAQAHLFHQPELERVLRDGLKRFPSVELRSRCEVTELNQTPEKARAVVRDLESDETFAIEADFVLGCDGARSMTRSVIGASMEDLGLHQPWLVVDILLKRDVDLPAKAVQICNPRRPATMIPTPPPRFRWEFMLMPGDDPEAIRDPASVERLLEPWVRPEDYEIERAAVYTFHALIARPWRKGRILILGDAAHQTPPFLGQGMCAGIRDAFNLCWKLVVARELGDPGPLLDSYESERRPHVERVIAHAVRLGRIIQSSNRFMAAARNLLIKAARFVPGDGAVPDAIGSIPIGRGLSDTSSRNLNRRRLPFPQPCVMDATGRKRLLDESLGAGFALVCAEGAPGGEGLARLNAAAMPLGLRRIDVNAPDSRGEGGHVVDTQGVLGAWFRERGANVALLRPDRIPLGAYDARPGESGPWPWETALAALMPHAQWSAAAGADVPVRAACSDNDLKGART